MRLTKCRKMISVSKRIGWRSTRRDGHFHPAAEYARRWALQWPPGTDFVEAGQGLGRIVTWRMVDGIAAAAMQCLNSLRAGCGFCHLARTISAGTTLRSKPESTAGSGPSGRQIGRGPWRELGEQN